MISNVTADKVAVAIHSALDTISKLLGRPVQGETNNSGKIYGSAKPVPALGCEFLTLDGQRGARETDIGSRRLKACVIPKHMNMQDVQVFSS